MCSLFTLRTPLPHDLLLGLRVCIPWRKNLMWDKITDEGMKAGRQRKSWREKTMEKKILREVEEEEGDRAPRRLMQLWARGFQLNKTVFALHISARMHAHTHTHAHATPCSTHNHMQVGLTRLVCQFAMPLVSSRETHRQASSHANTGTGPTHTHTHTYVYVCESSHLHFASLLLQALHYQDFACLYVFLHFHSPRETDVRNLGECLQHCGDFYRRKTE